MANAPTIAVIDYHKGNLSSVARGLARAGAEALVTDDPAQIRTADALVLPGVGSFYDAIAFMHESGQDEAVLDAVRGGVGVPFLGICLGLQLLFERGGEGVPTDGAAVESADPYGAGIAPGTVFEAEGRRWVRGLGLLHGSCTVLPSPQGAARGLGPGPSDAFRVGASAAPGFRRGHERLLHPLLCGGNRYRSLRCRRADALRPELRFHRVPRQPLRLPVSS